MAGGDSGELVECGSKAAAGWLGDDPEFLATFKPARSYRIERLLTDVRSLLSDAMATLRELVSDPEIPPAVRFRASLPILRAADALNVEEIGLTSAKGVEAGLQHKRFLESIGG